MPGSREEFVGSSQQYGEVESEIPGTEQPSGEPAGAGQDPMWEAESVDMTLLQSLAPTTAALVHKLYHLLKARSGGEPTDLGNAASEDLAGPLDLIDLLQRLAATFGTEVAKEFLHSLSDLQSALTARYRINPPPADSRCQCCGREIPDNEHPAGEPVFGILIKRFRPLGPPLDAETANLVAEASTDCTDSNDLEQLEDRLSGLVGPKEAHDVCCGIEMYEQSAASWECGECANLDNSEYFEKYASNIVLDT